MGDVVGRLFREFAVTLAVTIMISAVVSLTLTPMMCSRILRHDPEEQQARFYRCVGARVQQHHRLLRPHAPVVLRFKTITLLVALATLVLTVFLYIIIPKGFFPVQDTGVIQGISQAGASRFRSTPDGERAATLSRDHSAGSGGGKPVVVHRRGRHQHHPEQRAHLHQSETAGQRSAISAPRT